jgi:hypothetical protein
LQANVAATDTHDPAHMPHVDALAAARRNIESWEKLRNRSTWPLGEFEHRLRVGINGLAEFPEAKRLEALQDLDAWAGELDHLAKALELKTPQRWIDRLDS